MKVLRTTAALVLAVLGLLLFFAGLLLTVTLVGAILGVPMALAAVAMLLIALNLWKPGSLDNYRQRRDIKANN